MKTMKKKHHCPMAIALAIAGFTAFPTTGKSAVLFTDNFTGVAASVPPDSAGLNGVGWYFINGNSGGGAWSTETDNTDPLSGTVMWNPGGFTTYTYPLKQFTSTTLTNVGDSLTLTMDFHVAADISGQFLGIEFMDSATTYTSNVFATGALSIGNGYTVYQGLNSTTAQTATLRTTTGDVEYSGVTLATTSGSAILGATSTAHTLVFSLSKEISGTKLVWTVDGIELGNTTDATGYSTFNTVAMRGYTGVHVDNITVSTIPEPATWMLLTFGLTTVVLLRRRQLKRE